MSELRFKSGLGMGKVINALASFSKKKDQILEDSLDNHKMSDINEEDFDSFDYIVRTCPVCFCEIDRFDIGYYAEIYEIALKTKQPFSIDKDFKGFVDPSYQPIFHCPHCGNSDIIIDQSEAIRFLNLPARIGKLLHLEKYYISKEIGELDQVVYNGKRWFIADDIVSLLELEDIGSLLTLLNNEQYITIDDFDHDQLCIPESRKEITLINKQGFFRGLLKSKSPYAVIIQNWLTDNVMISLSNSNMYIRKEEIDYIEKDKLYAKMCKQDSHNFINKLAENWP
jgi:prophage antirepressor-like protein